jgi:YHS domain-containing protein
MVSVVPLACSKKHAEKASVPARVGEFVDAKQPFSRVHYFASNQVSINDRCLIHQRRLDPSVPPFYIAGKAVGFCSSTEITLFLQTPERYLAGLHLQLKGSVDSTRTAVLDPAHRMLVNDGIYYVADEAGLRAFAAAPYRYTGRVTDPVTGVRFQPSSESPSRSRGGRLFYFASATSVLTFDESPRKYTVPDPRSPSR